MPQAAAPAYVYRNAYREPDFWIPYTDLQVEVDWDRTIVHATLRLRRNPRVNPGGRSLHLHGQELELLSVAVNGRPLATSEYAFDATGLTLPHPGDVFDLTTTVAIRPGANRTMMGFCSTPEGELFTNFEAEAFRKLTFFLDRPDVLSHFTIKMTADKSRFPVLVASGNRAGAGDLDNGRHYAVFHTPIATPCYLIAMLAGRLEKIDAKFVTRSHREIPVEIYANAKHIDQCHESLKILLHAMRWEEETFGREYDLDVFACGVLNGGAGAMENKGLNIYDLAWFIADPRFTTDSDYEYRLKTIAHEYMHNWSGNRVTNRNWFYVSLKEGFTRFREQMYLADFAGVGPVRVRMTKHIRNNQFTEDDSAVAHAPIWDAYIEPRNLYTNTVYDKGQEIIQMLLAMLGRERFCKVASWYFDEYATQAVTIEEFLGAFEKIGGLDLSQFRKWYFQAGTCEIFVDGKYDPATESYEVSLRQQTRPTPGQPHKEPMHVPFAIGLIGPDGNEIAFRTADANEPQTTKVLELRQSQQSWRLTGVSAKPALSVLRRACAPVRVHYDPGADTLAHLFKHDTDEFARWEAGQKFATRNLQGMAAAFHAGTPMAADPAFLDAVRYVLRDPQLAPRMKADLVTLPDERTLGAETYPVDVDGIHAAREALMFAMAKSAYGDFERLYHDHESGEALDVRSAAIGRRRIKGVALDYLVRSGDPDMLNLALRLVKDGQNITDQVTALTILCNTDSDQKNEALTAFHDRWRGEQLVIDKWHRAQISAARVDTAARVDELMDSADFDIAVFSRLYTYAEAFFYENRYGLNEPGGSGYRVMTKQLLRIDKIIPFISNWTLNRCDMNRWHVFDARRQAMMRGALQTMLDTPGISPGLYEICSKSLAEEYKRESA
jgi:aminopeptidase N